jgi:hypothetical protein
MSEADRKLPTVQGYLQTLQPTKLRGWAYMRARPDEHLKIEVRLDGHLVTETIASTYFEDLEQHNIGKGDHGFLIRPRLELPVEQPGRVQVIALSSEGHRRVLELSSTAKARTAGAPPPPLPLPQPLPATKPAAPPRPAPAAAAPIAPPAPLHSATPNPNAIDHTQRPVFVLGSARSGTTAMMLALRQCGRYQGYNEGHLLPLFARLQGVVANHYGRSAANAVPGINTLIANVPAQMVTDALQSAFISIIRATFPTGFWLDKTPGPDMVKAVPLLRKIWPESRYIFMKRRPVDNIESRRRKFPTINFRDHCRLWADSMMSWHAIRDELAEVSLEVDQVQLAREPELTARNVAALLNLTEKETAALVASFNKDRPQRTGPDFTRIVDINSVDWSAEQRAAFAEICAEPIELFGYDADLAARR